MAAELVEEGGGLAVDFGALSVGKVAWDRGGSGDGDIIVGVIGGTMPGGGWSVGGGQVGLADLAKIAEEGRDVPVYTVGFLEEGVKPVGRVNMLLYSRGRVNSDKHRGDDGSEICHGDGANRDTGELYYWIAQAYMTCTGCRIVVGSCC